MPVNKVEYFGETLIDISDSTITPAKMLKDEIGYDKTGQKQTGSIETYEGEETTVVDDGKTRLYINVPENAMQDRAPLFNQVPLYFQQTVANGVVIDWGDGTNAETLPGTGRVNTIHTYAKGGEYVISLEPLERCELSFEQESGFCTFGAVTFDTRDSVVYPKMLNKVVIGKNVSSVGYKAFEYCKSLSEAIISDDVKRIGYSSFSGCTRLSKITLPNNLEVIGGYTFSNCTFLASVVIPEKVVRIADESGLSGGTFSGCVNAKEFHFLPVNPPALQGGFVDEFKKIPEDCIFYVPKGSVDAYKTATNWTVFADRIQEEPE